MSPRRAAIAVEVLLAGLLLVAVSVPLMDTFQTSHRLTVHDQRRLLALREAGRIEALLSHLPLARVRAAATGDASPGDIHARLADAGRGLDLAGLGVIAGAPAADPSLRSQVYFLEAEPGLGRVAIFIEWDDFPHPQPRDLVQVLLIEDPEQVRRIP